MPLQIVKSCDPYKQQLLIFSSSKTIVGLAILFVAYTCGVYTLITGGHSVDSSTAEQEEEGGQDVHGQAVQCTLYRLSN